MNNSIANTSFHSSKNVVGVIIAWGFSNNIFILLTLVKSAMFKDVIGQFMISEVLADMALHITTAFIILAGFYTKNLIFAMALGTSLASVKCLSLMELSIVLCIAIINPFKYMILISVRKVRVILALTWLWIPFALCYIVLEGTYYEMNPTSKRVDPNFTSQNWWVGALNLSVLAGVPLIVITVCVIKIIRHQKTAVLTNCYNKSATESKIRLAKLNTIIFIFHVLSQVPYSIAFTLHTVHPIAVAGVTFLFFMYPSIKLFIYLVMMRNFRRTAVQMCRCCCRNKKSRVKVDGAAKTSKSKESAGRHDSEFHSVSTIATECTTNSCAVEEETRPVTRM